MEELRNASIDSGASAISELEEKVQSLSEQQGINITSFKAMEDKQKVSFN